MECFNIFYWKICFVPLKKQAWEFFKTGIISILKQDKLIFIYLTVLSKLRTL